MPSYAAGHMVRTQISLAAGEYAAAKREAARLGISLTELVRRSLARTLLLNGTQPWMRYAGMVETRDSRSSQNVHDVVYGHRR